MKNYFSTLDEILYTGLRPWLKANNPDEKFTSMISGINTVNPAFQPQYEIKFERPFNSKTKFYSKLISNETINTCNQLFGILLEDNNPQLIKYRINDTLNKKLKSRLMDIGKLIKNQKFEIDYINPRKTTFDIDQEHKTNTYIFQLLKISFIQIYLEIQDAFKTWIQDELIVEDFYTQLLFEPVPNNSFINKIQIVEVEPEQTDELKQVKPVQRISIHSFYYLQLIVGSEKIANLCDSLKHFGFISNTTTLANFKKVFSNKEIITPIIWTGNPSEFSYFIKLIYVKYKLVENLKQKQWEIACNCFVQMDGTLFDKSKLRGLKKPQLSYKQLEVAVNNLK